MGVCETNQEPDSCPPHYTPPRPPPDHKGGDGPSPGNSPDLPGNNGGDKGNGWWPPESGPWPNRPGLWKLRKIRRGCDGVTPPPSLKLSSSSFSSDNYNDDEHVMAVLAEPEKAPAPMQKGFTTEREIEADYAYIAPSRVVQDSILDLDFAASASAREDFVDTTSR